jgi:hypothetical protein
LEAGKRNTKDDVPKLEIVFTLDFRDGSGFTSMDGTGLAVSTCECLPFRRDPLQTINN